MPCAAEAMKTQRFVPLPQPTTDRNAPLLQLGSLQPESQPDAAAFIHSESERAALPDGRSAGGDGVCRLTADDAAKKAALAVPKRSATYCTEPEATRDAALDASQEKESTADAAAEAAAVVADGWPGGCDSATTSTAASARL